LKTDGTAARVFRNWRNSLSGYNFTVYAANDKERSVNFGILNTYRQIWTPRLPGGAKP
jgi:hypothetical protein